MMNWIFGIIDFQFIQNVYKSFQCELITRLVLAWDPDYTKLTPNERINLEKDEKGEYVSVEDIDWDAYD